jgi:FkbM family methyltransferase
MNIRRATTEMGTFYYFAEDFFIAGALDHGFAWEGGVLHSTLAHLPAEGPCNVIDVGAHVGLHTIPYAHRVRERGLVYAFEPHAPMAELLCRNAEVNKCSASVEVFRFAAGHIDGVEVSLEDVIYDGPNAGQPYHYEDARAFNYGGLQLGLGIRKVVMRTLDSFAFADVALLKVDTEGAEPLVLWGARELIRRCRPLILFERNEKHITESMLSMIDIPQEVKAFRIEEYTSRLGYNEPLQLGDREYLLRPPRRR